MARQVLFIQGAGSNGAHEADGRLAQSLRMELGPDYEVRFPLMPNEDAPDYKEWKRVILSELEQMGEEAILVGHSIGASVLIRILADQGPRPKVAGLFLVSGPFWHDDEFWRWEEVALPADAAGLCPDKIPLFLYHGEDDPFVPVSHLDMYAKALPLAVVRRLRGRNHQLNDDLTEVARDIRGLA